MVRAPKAAPDPWFGSLGGGRWQPRTLQTGGNTLKKGTANALNDFFDLSLDRRDWGRAVEALKDDLGSAPKYHGKILENGDYADKAGTVLGNIVDCLD
jgi:hypothetical protein